MTAMPAPTVTISLYLANVLLALASENVSNMAETTAINDLSDAIDKAEMVQSAIALVERMRAAELAK